MENQSGQRRVYLKMTSVDEALGRLDEALDRLELGPRRASPEHLPPGDALGRVTAQAVFASRCNPHYCASAMDGYALKAEDTVGATEATPKTLEVPAEAGPLNTGEPLPSGRDAVVMIENVHAPSSSSIELMAAAAPWQHVRLMGEDVVASELVVTSGRRLGPVEIASMIASQVTAVPLVPRPSVALVPTGTEVIRPGSGEPKPGQVIDYDTPMLAGMIESWGGTARVFDPVPDEPELLRQAITHAASEHDLVAVIAGSSAGTADHVPNLIEALGELLVHGVRLSPGKPTAIGVVDGTVVLGIPGYSVAAWTAFDLFAKPVIARLLGTPTPQRPRCTASFRRKIPSRSGMHELLRVRLGRVDEQVVAVPLKRGAGAINSLAQADGLAPISELAEGVSPGESVQVELLVPLEDVERTVLAVGSHDIALDLLAHELSLEGGRHRLASIHVGSMGGLRALSQREAHLAGVHLLDPADSTYNVSDIKKVLPDRPLKLVTLVHREVGFMVLPGNPKGITSIGDLARDDVVMINRQRGAGTRVLLDHLLSEASISPEGLTGYSREVTTHTMVAAAVFGVAADVGLGIRAAATALGLEFVPLTTERYDLAIPAEHWEHPGVSRLVEMIRAVDETGRRFRARVEAMGGYSFSSSGDMVYEQ